MVQDFPEKIKSRGGDIFWALAVLLSVVLVSGAFRLYQVRTVERGPVEVHRGVFTVKDPVQQARVFVASKNGKNYYPIGCSAARRIKEENKIYFSSRGEAELGGFTFTKSCK